MPFDLPDSLKEKQRELRVFLDAEIAPLVDEYESKGPLSYEENIAMFAKLVPHGFIKSFSPTSVGGTGTTYLERAIMAEELGRVWGALAVTVDTHAGVIEMISRYGTEAHKKKWAEPGVLGKNLASDMVSEPQAGSDQTNLQTTAILDGDHYILNGEKMWITNGTYADVGIVTAVVDTEAYAANPMTGVISLIVDRHESPWQVRDIPFLGCIGGNTGHVVFDNVRVPKENLLHGADQGYKHQLVARSWFRVNIAAMAIGGMQAALEDSIAYAKQREAFRQPIAGFQLVQELIADMAMDTDILRLLVYRASCLLDKGVRSEVEQCMTKIFSGEASVRVSHKAIQVFGARGLTTEEGFRTERYYRDSVMNGVGEGTTQILKLVIGRKLTGVQAFMNLSLMAPPASQHALVETGVKVVDIIGALPTSYVPEKIEGVDASIAYDISGSAGGQWTVTIKDGDVDVSEGLKGDVKATIAVTDADYVAIATGQLDGTAAFMQGKIQVKGDMMFMSSFLKMFKPYSA